MIGLLVAVAMVIGLIGTVVPVIPGLLLMWAAAIGYAFHRGFDSTTWVFLGIISFMAIAGMAGSFIVPARKAGSAGAPRSSLWIGVVGAVLGAFLIPLVGIPVGGVAGIYAGERLRGVGHEGARQTTWQTLKGFGLGIALEFVMGLLVFGTWAAWAIKF